MTKSREGREDLVIGWSMTDGDTRQDRGGGVADMLLQLGLAVWALKPLVDGFARFGLRKTRNGVWCGTWRHREGCVEAKHSREGLMGVGCTVSTWTIMPLGLSGSRKYLRTGLECVI